jgi:hypothetical protein
VVIVVKSSPFTLSSLTSSSKPINPSLNRSHVKVVSTKALSICNNLKLCPVHIIDVEAGNRYRIVPNPENADPAADRRR